MYEAIVMHHDALDSGVALISRLSFDPCSEAARLCGADSPRLPGRERISRLNNGPMVFQCFQKKTMRETLPPPPNHS